MALLTVTVLISAFDFGVVVIAFILSVSSVGCSLVIHTSNLLGFK